MSADIDSIEIMSQAHSDLQCSCKSLVTFDLPASASGWGYDLVLLQDDDSCGSITCGWIVWEYNLWAG